MHHVGAVGQGVRHCLTGTVGHDIGFKITVYSLNGWTARTLTQTVTINYETPTTLNFYHTAKSALTVNKTDARTGNPLAGATFRITGDTPVGKVQHGVGGGIHGSPLIGLVEDVAFWRNRLMHHHHHH